MWNCGWKLKPETAADVEEESTIQGKRKRIYRYSRDNYLVHALLRHSEGMGLSGEDTMTWIAYEALKRVEQLEQLILDDHLTKPPQLIVSTAPPPTP